VVSIGKGKGNRKRRRAGNVEKKGVGVKICRGETHILTLAGESKTRPTEKRSIMRRKERWREDINGYTWNNEKEKDQFGKIIKMRNSGQIEGVDACSRNLQRRGGGLGGRTKGGGGPIGGGQLKREATFSFFKFRERRFPLLSGRGGGGTKSSS